MLELAENIWRRLNGDVPFSYVSPTTRSTTTCRSACPPIEKAREVLGFEATTSLDEMLDKVVPWMVEAMEQGLI